MHRAFSILVSLLLVPPAMAQILTTETQTVDPSAFSALPGAQRLEDTGFESEGGLDLPVRLPVIGFGDNFEGTIEGFESGDGLEETVIIDEWDGNWYAQFLLLPEGQLLIEGSILRLAAPVELGPRNAPEPTFENPQFIYLGDDFIADTEGAGLANQPVEIIASFAIGGALYRMTLTCKPNLLYACGDETTMRELIDALEILGRGTLQ